MRHIIIITILLSIVSCKKNHSNHNIFHTNQISVEIDTLAHRYLQLNRFSGTILVTKGDSLVYMSHFGLSNYEDSIVFTDSTPFKIGNLSKVFTSKLIHDLKHKNQLKLSDSVSKFLPLENSSVTIDNLLNNDIYSSNENIAYNTLGKIIEASSGKTYQENLHNYGKKIGLKNTYYDQQNTNQARGYLYEGKLLMSPTYNLQNAFSSYGIKSTAKDIAKIIDYSTEMDISGFLENDGFSYALKNNSQTKTAIIVLSNRRHPVASEISNAVEAILTNKAYRLPILRKHFDIDTALLKDYSGTYRLNANLIFDVIIKKDSLYVLLGENKVHLIPQSSNQFYMKETDAAMRFIKDSTGVTNEVILLNGFLDGDSAKRIHTSTKPTQIP